MISSIHSLRSKIVVYLQDLVQRHSQEQHARSTKSADGVECQPSVVRMFTNLLTVCLSMIWRIIPLPHSTHFCQYLHPLQNGIVVQWQLLQQQFQEQLVRSTVKSKMESWYIFCKWKVQSNRSRVFMSHSLIIFVYQYQLFKHGSFLIL